MALSGGHRGQVPYGRDQPCHASKLSGRLVEPDDGTPVTIAPKDQRRSNRGLALRGPTRMRSARRTAWLSDEEEEPTVTDPYEQDREADRQDEEERARHRH